MCHNLGCKLNYFLLSYPIMSLVFWGPSIVVIKKYVLMSAILPVVWSITSNKKYKFKSGRGGRRISNQFLKGNNLFYFVNIGIVTFLTVHFRAKFFSCVETLSFTVLKKRMLKIRRFLNVVTVIKIFWYRHTDWLTDRHHLTICTFFTVLMGNNH